MSNKRNLFELAFVSVLNCQVMLQNFGFVNSIIFNDTEKDLLTKQLLSLVSTKEMATFIVKPRIKLKKKSIEQKVSEDSENAEAKIEPVVVKRSLVSRERGR